MKNSDINNIYKLDGKVPVSKAIPFGLQHILAMFVANIAPIIIVSSACGLDTTETARLIQTAMIVAGIGSVIQLYPIWKVGSGLPIVMGISFTFVSVFCFVGHTRTFRKILGKTDFADCGGFGCNGYRLFAFVGRCNIVRRRFGCGGFRFG